MINMINNICFNFGFLLHQTAETADCQYRLYLLGSARNGSQRTSARFLVGGFALSKCERSLST